MVVLIVPLSTVQDILASFSSMCRSPLLSKLSPCFSARIAAVFRETDLHTQICTNSMCKRSVRDLLFKRMHQYIRPTDTTWLTWLLLDTSLACGKTDIDSVHRDDKKHSEPSTTLSYSTIQNNRDKCQVSHIQASAITIHRAESIVSHL